MSGPTLDSQTPSRHHTGVSAWWRVACIFLMLLSALGIASGLSMFAQFQAQIGHMQNLLAHAPHIQTVSILSDTNNAPAMLITFDPNAPDGPALDIQRLNVVVEGQEDSLQLWALNGTEAPRALGVLTPKLRTQALAINPSALDTAQQLAISVENRGGATAGHAPRLPYLFTGAVVKKAL